MPLSRIMQNLSLRYTKWINFSQSRTGHVFQGRFKALLLDADAYLMELVRYVHLNPVRAGASPTPEEYPWSGHRAYLGMEYIPWLTADWVLSHFSANVDAARKSYKAFVADGAGEGRRAEFHSGTYEGRILGDDTFADDVLGRMNQRPDRKYCLSDILNTVCCRYRISEEQFKAPGKARPYSEARAVAAVLVQEILGLSLTELGQRVNRDIAPLGRAARRLLQEAGENDRLKAQLRELRKELSEWQNG